MKGQIIPKGDRKYLLRVYTGSKVVDGKRKNQYANTTFEGTFSQAKDAIARMVTKVADNDYVPPTNQTLDQFLAHWLNHVKAGSVSPRTLTFYRARIQTVRSSLGSMKLTKVNQQGLQQFISKLSREEKLASSTVRSVIGTLKDALNTAVEYKQIPKNPCEGLKLPSKREKTRTMVAWDSKQTAEFLRATSDHPQFALWHLLLNTGLRPGEAFALRWSDLKDRVLTVRQAVVELEPETVKRDDGREVKRLRYGLDVPKTGAGRTVELSQDTGHVLQQHRRRQAEEILAAGAEYKRNDFIFATATGDHWSIQPVSNRWETCVKKSTLPTMSLYGCRHTHATIMLGELKTPLKVIAERLGNSPEVLMMHYQHVLPGMQASAVSGFEQLLRAQDG